MNSSNWTGTGREDGQSSKSFLDDFQFVTVSLLSIGIIANIYAVITLHRIKLKDVRKPTFSTTSMLILQHQGVTDLIVCIITLAFECYSQEHITPGEHTLYGPSSAPHFINFLTCHLWESYAIYWTFIFVSTWNMVFLASERFCAVVVPRCYGHMESSRVRIASFIVLYAVGLTVSLTEVFSVDYDPNDRMCMEKLLVHDNSTASWKRDISDSSDISWLIIAFFMPALFLILFNSSAVVRYRMQVHHQSSMRRVKSESEMESDRLQHRVRLLRSMTATSAAIATIFISANFWDAYLTLANLQAADYDKNTFEQRFARLLASLNSVCDPFVYYTVLPRVRRELSQNLLGLSRRLRCSKPLESD